MYESLFYAFISSLSYSGPHLRVVVIQYDVSMTSYWGTLANISSDLATYDCDFQDLRDAVEPKSGTIPPTHGSKLWRQANSVPRDLSQTCQYWRHIVLCAVFIALFDPETNSSS